MAQLIKRLAKSQFWIGAESVRDVFEPPPANGAGFFLAENIAWTPEGENYEPQYAIADGLKWRESRGTLAAQISFDILLKGSGTAGTPPDYAEALKAAGFQELVDPGVSVAYSPVLTHDGAGGNPAESYSAVWLEDDVLYAAKGGFCSWTFTGTNGQPGRISCTFMGGWVKVADEVLRRGANQPSYDPTKAPTFRGASMQYTLEGSAAYPGAGERIGVQNFNLDGGNVMGQIEDVNEKFGIVGSRIVDRKITGSFDPEMRSPSLRDWYDDAEDAKPFGLTTGVVNNSPGNRWEIDIRRAESRVPTQGDRSGVRILEFPFGVSSFNSDEEGGGNQPELTIKLT